ncbi:protein Brevis radix-like 1 isoform X2 [Dioscorea cayenensis subsp. rotundata]|uniref:Protein Brevis radix-like 1 isoform X2 n=1 Tax=Dioscorea cayennensis subsp. rotundata TaxID=55577 RepID=A0AB40BHS7_DIOCR|nr:protein Brevis radix-like 1 isoform X2 [Dioscorea cayenensis subsp. rotundata]
MLTCVASSKPLGGPPADDVGAVSGAGTPRRLAMKALTTQIREMAIRASGAYRQCKPCSRAWERRECTESEGLESGNGTPASMSGRTEESASMIVEEDEQVEREWIAQAEPGVLITFVSGAGGGNDLKRIRFREMFNKGQAQKWWAENHDKVLELYNVRSSSHPPPTLPGSEEESLKKEMVRLMTPSVRKERVPGNSNRAVMGSSSDDSQDHHQQHQHQHQHQQGDSSGGLAGTPKLSVNSGTNKGIVGTSSSSSSSIKEEEEVMDGCGSGEASVSSNGSSSIDQEREWVQQDEPGVYLTIRAHPGGIRELRRVRFSRERFGEMLARMWWEENRGRIHQQYIFRA